jgi:D-alanyl-D-alanine carboxypeptidase
MKVLHPELREKLSWALAARIRQRGAAAMAIGLPSDTGCWTVGGEEESHAEPLFLAYSLTKSLIAATVLKLCEEGHLRLSMVVSHWYPDLPQATAITIGHLLNHTAGLPDYGRLPAYHAAVRQTPSRPWTFQEFVAHTFAQGLWFPPGSGWAYSNPGYMLLKDIIERETGVLWQQVLASHVLAPLGLVHTRVAETLDDLRVVVPASSAAVGTDGLAHDIRQRYHPGWVAHGVVISTPRDIVAFYRGMFSGTLLSAPSVRAMTTLVHVPGVSFRFGPPGYGLGLMGTTVSPYGPLWGHNGSGPGFRASAFHAPAFPGGAVTVCVMCAIEDDDAAEGMVAETLALLATLG